jgi:hypothetical protein
MGGRNRRIIVQDLGKNAKLYFKNNYSKKVWECD